MKGWLDNYGKEENANNSKAKTTPGFVGDGTSNKGRNYSPAWGGQFKGGGKLPTGGLKRSEDYGSKSKPYPSVSKGDFAGGGRSYPIPTKEDAGDALRLAGLHHRPDVKAKVYAKYPELRKSQAGSKLTPAQREQAYKDSLTLYNESLRDIKFAKAANYPGEAIDFFESRYKAGEPRKGNSQYKQSEKAEKASERLKALNKKEPTPKRVAVDYSVMGIPMTTLNLPQYTKPKGTTQKEKTKTVTKEVLPKKTTITKRMPRLQQRTKLTPVEAEQIGIDDQGMIISDIGQAPVRVPKYFDVRDTVYSSMGLPNETSYKYYPGEMALLRTVDAGNKREMIPHYQKGGKIEPYGPMGKDIHGAPIIARESYDPDEDRSQYDPRTNIIRYGRDYTSWANPKKVRAHENLHARQKAEGRTNFDIAHGTDEADWVRMLKSPQMMTSDEVWDAYHNRKQRESDYDVNRIIRTNPQFRFVPPQLIYDKIVEAAQYNNPESLEGEAQYYENTGQYPYPSYNTGGSIPGTVGFSYARVGAPSNGKYAKKTMASAKQGRVIKDDMGQWAYPGEITEINSNDITMKGVPYDVIGISDTGDTKRMKPGKDYKFKGNKVTEIPIGKDGRKLVELDQLTNFTNYNKPQPGGWLDKY